MAAMQIDYQPTPRDLQKCVPPAWGQARRFIAWATIAAAGLVISAHFWAVGLRSPLWGGWIAIALCVVLVLWRRRANDRDYGSA